MTLNECVMFLLIFSSWVVAKDAVKDGMKDTLVSGETILIISIIFVFLCVFVGLMILGYFTLKFLKRKISEPQYYIDETSHNKDSMGYHDGNNDIHSQAPNIYQVQPVLSVSHMASSIKQSLQDLRDSLIPFSWSHAQQTYNHQNPVNEKIDLPV